MIKTCMFCGKVKGCCGEWHLPTSGACDDCKARGWEKSTAIRHANQLRKAIEILEGQAYVIEMREQFAASGDERDQDQAADGLAPARASRRVGGVGVSCGTEARSIEGSEEQITD